MRGRRKGAELSIKTVTALLLSKGGKASKFQPGGTTEEGPVMGLYPRLKNPLHEPKRIQHFTKLPSHHPTSFAQQRQQ